MNSHKDKDTAATQDSDTSSKQSRLISKILSPALKLFLRSQVERVSQLEVKISGSDRSFLMGNIPHVSISASQVVYQGLYLAQIQLVGEGIRTNLRQILKGQPLRLVEPVLVSGELLLQQTDLNASLQSPLLSNALTELLQMLVPASHQLEGSVSWDKISVTPEKVILSGTLANSNRTTELLLRFGLQLLSSHELQLIQPQLQISPDGHLEKLENFPLDLGSQVDLQELSLHSGQVVCRGSTTVMP